MIYITLFYEFFKTGLFAIGGGYATLPFLYDIAEKYTWLDKSQLVDMIAVSESTPGPLGVNMATYCGYTAAGIMGGIVATFALVLPSVIIIIIVAKFLTKFNDNRIVKNAFSGLRPAVAALIAAAGYEIFKVSLLYVDKFKQTKVFTDLFDIRAIILFIIMLFCIQKFKKHPIIYIISGGIIGVILGL